jgi:hypothetical protein
VSGVVAFLGVGANGRVAFALSVDLLGGVS